ncbi:MAG: hypothetical protein PHS97_04045 [Oscillospiraceae bacterium]|nr:hypothetical protein [Oscillospiraceae bacterium]
MFQNIRYALQRFMYGRNGADTLSWALIILGAVLCLVSSLTSSSLLYVVGYLPLMVALFRMYSRNLEKRHAENAKFCGFFTHLKDRQNRYFSCPNCAQTVRVPRGKGKINIRCPKCGRQFVKKT